MKKIITLFLVSFLFLTGCGDILSDDSTLSSDESVVDRVSDEIEADEDKGDKNEETSDNDDDISITVIDATSTTAAKMKSTTAKTTTTTVKNTTTVTTAKKIITTTKQTTVKTENKPIVTTKAVKNESVSQGNGGSSNSVKVPEHEEKQGNLVWVPVNGGKKYHSSAGCSNMDNPMQVTKETATANGYTPCKRCY